MNIKEKISEAVMKYVFIFIVSLIAGSPCMLFLDMSFKELLVYSAINALWMPYLVLPVIRIIKEFEFGKTGKSKL